MVPTGISKFILELEERFPVDTWKINGIDIWPIIRVKIQTKINISINTKFTRKPASYGGYSNYGFFQKIIRVFSSLSKINSLNKADFIGTSNFSHRSVYKNEYYNKFYDPILDRVNSNGLIIEHNSKEFYSDYPIHNSSKVMFFEDLFYYRYFINSVLRKLKLYKPIKKIELKGYSDFLKELGTIKELNGLADEFELKKMEYLLFNLLTYKRVYSKIIKKTKPDYVFEICHYNVNSIALTIAANELGVPSVEIQHGGQPTVHMAYGVWTKVPDSGYNTIPEIYWNWDQESKENLDQWVSNNRHHKTIVLGNPWIDYFKSQLSNEEKKYVLYSLQPISFELIFPPYLVDFIKNNPEYKWWMRIHPTDINRKQDYLDFFNKNKIEDLVIFDDGSKLSLPETLSQSKLHITYSSGTLMEAAELGIKTIVLDTENAKNYFESYIEKGEAFAMNSDFGTLFNQVISLKSKTKISTKDFNSCFEELDKLKN